MPQPTQRRRVIATDPSGRGTSAWVTAIRQRAFPTPTLKLLMLVLTDYVNGDDECWPGHTTLAPEVGVTVRTMQTLLADLEDRGVIEREERWRSSGRGRAADLIRFRYAGIAAAFPLIGVQPENLSGTAESITGNETHVQPEVERIRTSCRTPSVEPPTSFARRASFNDFWEAYPRKLAKGAAKVAWVKATKEVDADLIVSAAKRYTDDPNRSDEFTAYPATWLNQERWEDEPLPQRNGQAQPTSAQDALDEWRRKREQA